MKVDTSKKSFLEENIDVFINVFREKAMNARALILESDRYKIDDIKRGFLIDAKKELVIAESMVIIIEETLKNKKDIGKINSLNEMRHTLIIMNGSLKRRERK